MENEWKITGKLNGRCDDPVILGVQGGRSASYKTRMPSNRVTIRDNRILPEFDAIHLRNYKQSQDMTHF